MKVRFAIPGLCAMCAFCAMCAMCAAASAAPPATKPAELLRDDSPQALLKEWAKEKADDEKEAKSYRSLGQVSIRDIIQFRMDGDQILMDSPQIGTNEKLSYTLKEMPGFGTFSVIKSGNDAKNPMIGLTLTHRDYSHPGETIQTEVLFPTMQIARDVESPGLSVNISLIQNVADSEAGERVRLNVEVSNSATGKKTADLHLSAASLPQLRREHPTEIAKYLRPVLHDLRAENLLADPAAQWQVFAPSLTPPAEVNQKVMELIKGLDADALPQRQAALKDLQKLGAPAALVVMKLDRAKFSAEQNIALDAFAAPYAPLSPSEVEKARNDPDFLIDCLMAEDGRIRSLAAQQLTKVLGHPIAGYEPDAPPRQRAEAAEKLREKLFPPTTQPG
jgi:hypothetical protein